MSVKISLEEFEHLVFVPIFRPWGALLHAPIPPSAGVAPRAHLSGGPLHLGKRGIAGPDGLPARVLFAEAGVDRVVGAPRPKHLGCIVYGLELRAQHKRV